MYLKEDKIFFLKHDLKILMYVHSSSQHVHTRAASTAHCVQYTRPASISKYMYSMITRDWQILLNANR